jgi:hypothetical protein
MNWVFILIVIVALIVCCFIAVTGINHMNKNFPDYKADDFFKNKEDEQEN